MLQSPLPGLYVAAGTLGANDVIKIAAFDLDWTIVRTVQGRFPKDANDWAFLPNRVSTLQSYRDTGYTLVLFANQGYKGAKLTTALARVNNILEALAKEGIQPWTFAATLHDNYRKPGTGMWDLFQQYMAVYKKTIDKSESFYVGDAAGRPGDYDNNDILLAQNIGLTFFTPEQKFPRNQIQIPDTQTMFIFVGMPGSGKTTYYTQNLAPKGWVHVNQDILKTQPKMLNAVRTALASGKSVAIDATNPSPNKRAQYIMIAAELRIPTMILYFVDNGYERNQLRQAKVPDIAYNVYFKNLVEPTYELDRVPVVQVS